MRLFPFRPKLCENFTENLCAGFGKLGDRLGTLGAKTRPQPCSKTQERTRPANNIALRDSFLNLEVVRQPYEGARPLSPPFLCFWFQLFEDSALFAYLSRTLRPSRRLRLLVPRAPPSAARSAAATRRGPPPSQTPFTHRFAHCGVAPT